ncbi:Adenosine kinase [Ascosphaera apis ARSEF 7405]|uniref:Adenosine kinase n=1 Tax=Ascosphaera apis ARSEF 7405 TaxID=392613 RepID=A0A168AHK2_9EURO|nr:Adenosine kinase [Ascosphaera apis ARSEF 7405]
MASGYPLVCLENPLLDIQGVGDDALLQKYGVKANDAILAEEKHMGLYDDLLHNHNAVLFAGGSVQNTARGAQYMLPENSVMYLGCVGNDKWGEMLKTNCEKEGVHTEYRIDEKEPTGRCGVIITGKNRSLITHLAAANEYKLDHLQSPKVWDLVKKGKIYYVGGYHLTVCVPAILAIAEEALKENKLFAFNFSAPFIPQFFKDPLSEVLPYCDIVLGNETEARAVSEAYGFGTTDVEEIAKKVVLLPKKNEKRSRIVFFTQGTDPTIAAWVENGEVKTSSTPIIQIDPELICDTNGAGDAFAGGLCAGLTQGKDIQECVNMGHWLANLSIRELGPSYPATKQHYKA